MDIVAWNRGRDFVSSIMGNIEQIPDSGGMRCMRGVRSLLTGRPYNVVIRSITEPFWEECIKVVNTSDYTVRVCAIGTPGIGKTTSAPFLIRMLLETRHTVVYRLKPEAFFWEFKWKDEEIIVNVYPEEFRMWDIESLNESSTFYIVDPGKTADDCVPPLSFEPRTIIVSSPDERHWGGKQFLKLREDIIGTFRYFPMWDLDELLSARDYFSGSSFTNQDIESRFRQVGGVPRNIFLREDFFATVMQSQNDAVRALSALQAEEIVEEQWDAMGSFGSNQPKSAIIGYTKPKVPEDCPFSSRNAAIISPTVAEKIVAKFMASLWRLMLQEDAIGWKIFGIYCRTLMATPSVRSFVGRLCCERSSFDYYHEINFQLGGCKTVRLGLNVVTAVIEGNPMTLFHSTNSSQFLFDFIYKDNYGTFHAFQATQGRNHDVNVHQIQRLRSSLGDSPLFLYYLVPGESFQSFVTNPRSPETDLQTSVWHIMIPNPNI